MSDQTGIEWTDATWNPVTGCTKVSPGCKNCYAERLAVRLRAMGNPRYQNGFALTLQPDQLTLPLRWRQARRIFVNSMSDLFHEAVPDDFIHQVFEVMKRADWHIFQALTKRSARLAALAPSLSWAPNIWQGVSVENARYTRRVRDLQSVPAESGGQEERGPLSLRLRVPPVTRRGGCAAAFKITICDLEVRPERQVPTTGVHCQADYRPARFRVNVPG